MWYHDFANYELTQGKGLNMERFLDYILNKLGKVLEPMTANEQAKFFINIGTAAVFIILLLIIYNQYVEIQSYKNLIISREEKLENFLAQLQDDLTIIKYAIEDDIKDKSQTEIIKAIDKYFTERRIIKQK